MTLSHFNGRPVKFALLAVTLAIFLTLPGVAAKQATPAADHDHGDAVAEPKGAPLSPRPSPNWRQPSMTTP